MAQTSVGVDAARKGADGKMMQWQREEWIDRGEWRIGIGRRQ